MLENIIIKKHPQLEYVRLCRFKLPFQLKKADQGRSPPQSANYIILFNFTLYFRTIQQADNQFGMIINCYLLNQFKVQIRIKNSNGCG